MKKSDFALASLNIIAQYYPFFPSYERNGEKNKLKPKIKLKPTGVLRGMITGHLKNLCQPN